MQESEVGWDPVAINQQLPWQAKIFIIYMLFIALISIFRLVATMHAWFRARKSATPQSTVAIDFWKGLAGEIDFVRR